MSSVTRVGMTLIAMLSLFACGATEDPSAERTQGGAAGSAARAAAAVENERVVIDFIRAWSRMDPAELASYFSEDGIYHNMPAAPVQGRANIESMIRGFTASWTETAWEIVTLVSTDDVVIAERIDRTRAGDRSVDLPVVGVFEMEGGKIKVWRDYFDLATYTRGMS